MIVHAVCAQLSNDLFLSFADFSNFFTGIRLYRGNYIRFLSWDFCLALYSKPVMELHKLSLLFNYLNYLSSGHILYDILIGLLWLEAPSL